MPAQASLSDLESAKLALEIFKKEQPESFERIQKIFTTYRKIGFRNLAKLILEETTPRKLKGLED